MNLTKPQICVLCAQKYNKKRDKILHIYFLNQLEKYLKRYGIYGKIVPLDVR